MTREEALNVIWLRCQHNDKTYEAYCVLKHEQQPCDKCVYSTSEGCQYDDITETIPPFDDCISRQAVEKITWEEPSYTDALNVLTEIREKVRALPPVIPQPKTGHWIDDGQYAEGHSEHACRCSKCGYTYIGYTDKYKDCPNCGSKMLEVEE